MSGERAAVKLVNYHTLDPDNVSEELYEKEKYNYPVLYVTLLSYDGEAYKSSTRASTKTELEGEQSYQYLLHEIGSKDYTDVSYSYEYYILSDDPEMTLEKYYHAIVSSSFSEMAILFTTTMIYSSWWGLQNIG